MVTETTVPMDDAALYGAAIADEKPPAVEPERQERQEPEARAEPDAGPVRDEQGRFAPKAKADEAPAAQKLEQQPQSQVGQQPPRDDQASVPSWRVREIREELERKAADAERIANERYQAQVRQFMAEQQARQQPAKPPDHLADPDGWLQHVTQQQRSEIDRARFELSEDMARDKFGDAKVDQALAWLQTSLDAATRQRITTARNPYREMVKLYDERQTLQQIGGDLGAYKTRILDEAIKDPAFMEKVAAHLREQQSGNGSPTNGQRPVVQLPPSIGRATGARVQESAAADMSGESLYAYAIAPEQRRR